MVAVERGVRPIGSRLDPNVEAVLDNQQALLAETLMIFPVDDATTQSKTTGHITASTHARTPTKQDLPFT